MSSPEKQEKDEPGRQNNANRTTDMPPHIPFPLNPYLMMSYNYPFPMPNPASGGLDAGDHSNYRGVLRSNYRGNSQSLPMPLNPFTFLPRAPSQYLGSPHPEGTQTSSQSQPVYTPDVMYRSLDPYTSSSYPMNIHASPKDSLPMPNISSSIPTSSAVLPPPFVSYIPGSYFSNPSLPHGLRSSALPEHYGALHSSSSSPKGSSAVRGGEDVPMEGSSDHQRQRMLLLQRNFEMYQHQLQKNLTDHMHMMHDLSFGGLVSPRVDSTASSSSNVSIISTKIKSASPNVRSKGGESAYMNGKSVAKRKQHTCGYEGCNYMSYRASNMQAHIRHHTNDRPFQCDHAGCNYAASQASNLKVHKRIHQGDRPYRCLYTGCVYGASQLYVLKSHIKRVHNIVYNGDDEEFYAMCQHAKEGIDSSSSMPVSATKSDSASLDLDAEAEEVEIK